MSSQQGHGIKVVLPIEKDGDGYPPVDSELVWVTPTGEHRGVIDNIPFFATVATLGDVIEYESSGEQARYSKTLARSGNSLIRVAYVRDSDLDPVRIALVALGCEVEHDATHQLLAVNVPPSVPLVDVQAYLGSAAQSREIEFEEPILMQ